jgi:hypothetical protein
MKMKITHCVLEFDYVPSIKLVMSSLNVALMCNVSKVALYFFIFPLEET